MGKVCDFEALLRGLRERKQVADAVGKQSFERSLDFKEDDDGLPWVSTAFAANDRHLRYFTMSSCAAVNWP